MKTYTSEQILSDEDLFNVTIAVRESGIGIQYQMTDDELQWLDFVKGKYSIYDYINNNLKDGILTIQDSFELSEALDNDCTNAGKAVCLDDSTALQKIFFHCYSERYPNE